MSEKSPMDRMEDARKKTEEVYARHERTAELGREMSKVAMAEFVTRMVEKMHEKIQNDPRTRTDREFEDGIDGPDSFSEKLERLMKALAEGKVRLVVEPKDLDADALRRGDGLIHFYQNDWKEGEERMGGSFSVSLLKRVFDEGEWEQMIN